MNTFRKLTLFIFVLIILFLVISVPGVSAQQSRIYIANDDHTDYMWTANEATYRSAFVQMIDYYLDQANSTSGNASPYQGRFNLDGSFWVYLYQQDRPARFAELINRIKDGHISVPMNSLVTVYGGQSVEAIIRGMYYPGKLERQYDVHFPIAHAMENQTMPFGLGSLWVGSGVKYSWKGVCDCATVVTGLDNRQREIYWWVGADNSKILMKWYSVLSNQSLGGYAEARRPGEAVDILTNDPAFNARYPYNVKAAFGKGWDDLQTKTSEFITTAQQKTNTSQQVYVSNEVDFFKDFEASYGSTLPTQSLSFGNEWDLFTPLLQEVSSSVRRGVEQLRSAEAMATMISLKNPTFMNKYSSLKDLAYYDLSLFWEHCGTAGNVVGDTVRLTWLKKMASTFTSFSNSIYTDSITTLSNLIVKTGTNPRFFVFNSLGWVRTDVADYPYSGSLPIHVVDVTTGADTPSQIITKNGVQTVRILASNIPSVGYKAYEIRTGSGTAFSNPVTVSGNTFENSVYKLTVSPGGAITSLIDKTKSNREFSKVVNGKTINDLGQSTTGTVVIENSGPVSTTLLATSSVPVAHTSRITLYNTINRIDIQNDINQNFTNNQIWSFGYNLTNPDTNHEEIGAVIKAKLASSGGQYSTKNARYDWMTLNHFVDMTGSEGFGVTLSNWDLDFYKLGNSSATSLDATTPGINVLAGGDAGSFAPPVGQADSTHFLQRFALMTHASYSQTAAMKMSVEHQNPFVTAVINGGTEYPEQSFSLLSVSNPDTLLWSVKPHEDGIGSGVVLRFWNQKPTMQNSTITFPNKSLTLAKNISHIETDIGDVGRSGSSFSDSINENQIKSYRVILGTTSGTPNPSPTGTVKSGDINTDGSVDILDIGIVVDNYGKIPIVNSAADLNHDLSVDILDLGIIIDNYGR